MPHIDPNINSVGIHKSDSSETPLVQVIQTFNAPIEKVFEAWSNEDLLKQWWAPMGLSAPVVKVDFQVGGQYLLSMRKDEGGDVIWSTGKYIDIIPNRFIVMQDSPSNEKGEVLEVAETDGPFADRGPSYITIEIAENGTGQSILTLSHEGLPARMHYNCVEGWASALSKLKTVVERH